MSMTNEAWPVYGFSKLEIHLGAGPGFSPLVLRNKICMRLTDEAWPQCGFSQLNVNWGTNDQSDVGHRSKLSKVPAS